jgi:hypothetical protein
MVCPSCLAIPITIIGIGSLHTNLVFGFLLTILSTTIYLHYKQLQNCSECKNL